MTVAGNLEASAIGHVTGATSPSRLTLRRLGVDTYQEHIVYMRADCHVCRSEGFEARSRVRVSAQGKSLLATLNVVKSELLGSEEASLSEAAWALLGARDGDVIEVTHAEPIESERFVRAKAYGERLPDAALGAIVGDIAKGLYSDLHLAAFVTACAGNRLDLDETIGLTRAMIAVGDRISWPYPIVADKHCVGGLPGNRTTMLVVPIVAALGLPIPKTSSRAITSPAGTADTMETLAPVNLDLATMRRVVEREGGCVTWGGTARLSPADDVLIHVERPLDFDSEGQLVASVLSKKVAAGATHAVFDVPVGPTAKVRSREAARRLGERLAKVGSTLGLNVRIVETDGIQPVGRGSDPLSRRGMSSRLFNDDRTSRPTCVTARCILPGSCWNLAVVPAWAMVCASRLKHFRQGVHGENSKPYVKRRVACGPRQVPSTCTWS